MGGLAGLDAGGGPGRSGGSVWPFWKGLGGRCGLGCRGRGGLAAGTVLGLWSIAWAAPAGSNRAAARSEPPGPARCAGSCQQQHLALAQQIVGGQRVAPGESAGAMPSRFAAVDRVAVAGDHD